MFDKELLALIKGNRKYVVLAVILGIVGMLANVGVTALLCLIAYNAHGETDISAYYLPVAGIIGAIALRLITHIFTGKFKGVLGAGVKKDLRHKTYGKILRLGTRAADSESMAGLTQMSLEGIEQLDLYYTSYLPQFFYSMLAPLILFGIAVFIDWKTALVLLAAVPIIPVVIIRVSKFAKKIFAKYWGKYIAMGSSFLDNLQGLRELKIFNADKRTHELMNNSAEEFRQVTMKVLIMQLVSTTVMDLVAFGGAGAGIAVAIFSGVDGLDPFKVLFLVLIAVEFFLPLRALGSAFHVAMNGASAGKKILALLKTPEENWGKDSLDGIDEITLTNVSFGYNDSRRVINDVNLTVSKNDVVAIVGESGSGKSTIVSLLTGALKAQSGTLTVNCKDLFGYSRESYYGSLAVVSYNTYIFNDTLRNNFRLAKESVSDEEMWEALKKVNLDGFVRENGGLDKPISEDAANISGGQKQRLALAVNLVSGKNFYIFDEATSNIDVESEAIIIANIASLKASAGIVLISHRLENVVGADKIFVLKDGVVAEHGKHGDLLNNKGEYARLYTTQKALELGYKGVSANA